jgi:hypothetical protein
MAMNVGEAKQDLIDWEPKEDPENPFCVMKWRSDGEFLTCVKIDRGSSSFIWGARNAAILFRRSDAMHFRHRWDVHERTMTLGNSAELVPVEGRRLIAVLRAK